MKITSVVFKKSVVELVTEFSPIRDLTPKPQVFFLGRSNVGKSSMINSLFGKSELARVSAQAGKTRTINFFEVNERYECLDFPGYGYARGGKQNTERLRNMIVDYLEKNLAHHVRTVVIVDAYVGPTAIDEEIL
jgi:GTP-binding protein